MKKSKLIFGLIALLIAIICAVVFFITRSDSDSPSLITPPRHDKDVTTPYITEPEEKHPENLTEPYGPDHGVAGILRNYELADNVRITQVEKDPNEVIHAYEPIDPKDPEYLPSSEENYETVEGKVYRNDKTISIDIFDEFNGRDITITFGYITGELNRFLYLNPVYEHSTQYSTQYGFYFKTMQASGNVITLPVTYDTEEEMQEAKQDAMYFHVGRTLDENNIATYQDPTHPGTVWFTQTPINTDLWIDVVVYQMGGDMLATLRLTIAKGDDGTYSIVNLENKNLLQTYEQKNAKFTKSELAYIYEHAKLVIEDYETVGMMQTPGFEMNIERCLMEYRDQSTGLYYTYFVPNKESGKWYARDRDYLDNPVIAVSIRQTGGVATASVLYFRIDKMPTDSEHGIYSYIGRDFFFYTSQTAMSNQGHPDY